MTGFLYYPGCSMGGTGRAYADSLGKVAGPLGLDLHEVPDWNCCGASEYLSIGQLRAYSLIARNLALAERAQDGSSTLVAPCSLCYVNLAKTDRYMRDDRALRANVNEALGAGGLGYAPGSIAIRHLFEVIVDDIGLERVRGLVVAPLRGLRVAPYLGCLVTRPDVDRRWASHEHPQAFDDLLGALGAEVVDFPLKTECCGGHMTQIGPGTAFAMIRRLIDTAERLGADMLATICPMCQMNVDFYQPEANRHFHSDHRMPILFFTQLMGLAFGFAPKELGIGSEVVSARAALAKIGIDLPLEEVPDAGAPGGHRRPRREKSQGLPMPSMPDVEEEALK
jgi:heterodisulfide reductase subunit B